MKVFKTILLCMLALCIANPVFAIQKKQTAKVLKAEGPVQIKLVAEKNWIDAKPGTELGENDIVRTRKNSTVIIGLNGNGKIAEIELKENSQLMFLELVKDNERKTQNTPLDLAAGEAVIKTHDLAGIDSKFEIKTPTSAVAVQEGSASFSIKVERLD